MGHSPRLAPDGRARASVLAAACVLAGLALSVTGLYTLYLVVTAGGAPRLPALYGPALAVLGGAFLLGLAAGIASDS